MSACAYCKAEVRDQVICPRCQRVTAANLADVPEHVAELTTVMVKETNYAEKSDGGRSTDPTIAWARLGDKFLDEVAKEIERNPIARPYTKAAAESWHELRAHLVSWVRLLNEERGIALPADRTEALGFHLRRNMTILAGHVAAGEFVAETTKIVKRIMIVIDSPAFRSKIPVGPCVAVFESIGECPGEVVAYTYRDEDVIGKMACRHCKTEWEPRRWYEVGDKIKAKMERLAA